jgi:hypothetical protein
MNKSNFIRFILTLSFFFPFAIWAGLVYYKSTVFSIECSGHIKRAADANTVELAKKELKTVLDYLEKNKLTQGSTAVLWDTPQTDIEFFYTNIKSSYIELDKVTDQTSQLEKTNILLKLRETLLDPSEHGYRVTRPSDLYLYPGVTFWFIWMWGALIYSGIGVVLILVMLFGD